VKYLVFCGAAWYPSGGWKDLVGSAPTLDEAVIVAEHFRKERISKYSDEFSKDDGLAWVQVVNLELGTLVWSSAEDLPDILLLDKTFADAVSLGKAKPSEINDWVDVWHEYPNCRTLREFLGIVEWEYEEWVKDPSFISKIFSGPAY
jgi:hypothetical protein